MSTGSLLTISCPQDHCSQYRVHGIIAHSFHSVLFVVSVIALSYLSLGMHVNEAPNSTTV